MTGIKVKESSGYILFKFFNTIIMLFVCAITLYPFLYLVAVVFFGSSNHPGKSFYPSNRI